MKVMHSRYASRRKRLHEDIQFLEGGAGLLDEVGPLWKRLTSHHAAVSPHFAREFAKRTWTDRKKELMAKAHAKKLHVIIARLVPSLRPIGYGVGTVNRENVAEIDSLYVEDGFRSRGIGCQIISRMLAWMKCRKPSLAVVNVAVGNEDALPFYQRFGFYPRVTTLVRKRREK